MKINWMMLALAVVVVTPAFADSGHGMGTGGGMMAGSGMMVVADDSSLLVTSMDMSGMMGGGSFSTPERELVNIDADGSERWRVSFDEGWPMMPCTDGDLVVVVLRDDWFMGFGGMGDGGWSGGGRGGGMGGGMKDGEHGPGDGESVLVALDLVTGQERWRATISGDMASMPQFSPDGSMIFVSAREMSIGGMGPGSVRQGDATPAGFMSSSRIVSFDRAGTQLWTYDLGGV
jgi:outer membrane protein assembly factor BamB